MDGAQGTKPKSIVTSGPRLIHARTSMECETVRSQNYCTELVIRPVRIIPWQ
jgi:hypothetical protein